MPESSVGVFPCHVGDKSAVPLTRLFFVCARPHYLRNDVSIVNKISNDNYSIMLIKL